MFNYSFYTNTDEQGPAHSFKMSAGLKQTFPSKVTQFDLSKFEESDLTVHRRDYYPVVITAETIFPDVHRGKSRRQI